MSPEFKDSHNAAYAILETNVQEARSRWKILEGSDVTTFTDALTAAKKAKRATEVIALVCSHQLEDRPRSLRMTACMNANLNA